MPPWDSALRFFAAAALAALEVGALRFSLASLAAFALAVAALIAAALAARLEPGVGRAAPAGLAMAFLSAALLADEPGLGFEAGRPLLGAAGRAAALAPLAPLAAAALALADAALAPLTPLPLAPAPLAPAPLAPAPLAPAPLGPADFFAPAPLAPGLAPEPLPAPLAPALAAAPLAAAPLAPAAAVAAFLVFAALALAPGAAPELVLREADELLPVLVSRLSVWLTVLSSASLRFTSFFNVSMTMISSRTASYKSHTSLVGIFRFCLDTLNSPSTRFIFLMMPVDSVAGPLPLLLMPISASRLLMR
mmetsp:Transcript_18449/g.56387  ORF Transcript_18449/g.56387 Transcript_18449/m.56387 type:complete len:307 (-) Transcript_18449:459-1379(-)